MRSRGFRRSTLSRPRVTCGENRASTGSESVDVAALATRSRSSARAARPGPVRPTQATRGPGRVGEDPQPFQAELERLEVRRRPGHGLADGLEVDVRDVAQEREGHVERGCLRPAGAGISGARSRCRRVSFAPRSSGTAMATKVRVVRGMGPVPHLTLSRRERVPGGRVRGCPLREGRHLRLAKALPLQVSRTPLQKLIICR